MKELSIEEKAKRYDEALKVLHKYDGANIMFSQSLKEEMFPELCELEDEKSKKEIINYLECQSRDEPSRKDTHNKWISYIEKYALSKDDYSFLRDCARVLKTFGWQSYADRLTTLCPALGEEAKAMMSTPIIFDESEDERIRRFLIKCVEQPMGTDFLGDIKKEDVIAWLEAQGEQKPTDKVKSKFKVGDWVIDKQGIVHQIANVIENVTCHTYGYDIVGGGYFNDNTEGVRLWTIQDAKDGDVLATDDGICIFDGTLEEGKYPFAYCGITKRGFDSYDARLPFSHDNNIQPATKEQRDQLEKAMTDAGYTFDFDKKELKKIEQKPADDIERKYNPCYNMSFEEAQEYISNRGFDIPWTDCDVFVDFRYVTQTVANILRWADDNPIQNPVWSEEDELKIDFISKLILGLDQEKYNSQCMKELADWLKSLKERVQPQQKQEWSEEDEKMVSNIRSIIEKYAFSQSAVDVNGDLCEKEYIDADNWLKSIRPQSQWKPSEEQMKFLWRYAEQNNYDGSVLTSLYNDLKKLKE